MDSQDVGVSTTSPLWLPVVRIAPNDRVDLGTANVPPDPIEWRTASAAARERRTMSANSRQKPQHRSTATARTTGTGTKQPGARNRAPPLDPVGHSIVGLEPAAGLAGRRRVLAPKGLGGSAAEQGAVRSSRACRSRRSEA